MTTLRLVAGLAIALGGCYAQTPTPQYANPEEVSGPPGGTMDQPTMAQYESDSQQAEYQGPAPTYNDPGGAPDATGDASQPVEPEPSADPQDPGYTMGPVSDGEIDSTLGNYGEWVEDPDYGRVWRPYATVVGVDFTPYETCGSWAWTDWGYSYNCDWDWGWLPFHYGRWGMMDGGYWGWVPGHEWGPGWVDWRHGGGYVGWRPSAPEFHDHRGQHQGPEFHDHRTGGGDSQWRFVSQHDFGNGHIHGHLYNDLAEGLRVTSPVTRLPLRGTTQPIRVATTMRARMENPVWRQTHAPATGWRQPAQQPQRFNGGIRQPAQTGWRQPPQSGWRQPSQSAWRQPPQTGWQQPRQPVTVPRQPSQSAWRQPQGSWQQPQRSWSPPQTQRPTWNEPRPQSSWNSRPTYSPPAYHPAPSSGWSRPSSSYTAPSRSWSAPSHSSWSAPSHSSSSSFGGSHSFGGGGGGGHSGGGGGHHR